MAESSENPFWPLEAANCRSSCWANSWGCKARVGAMRSRHSRLNRSSQLSAQEEEARVGEAKEKETSEGEVRRGFIVDQ